MLPLPLPPPQLRLPLGAVAAPAAHARCVSGARRSLLPPPCHALRAAARLVLRSPRASYQFTLLSLLSLPQDFDSPGLKNKKHCECAPTLCLRAMVKQLHAADNRCRLASCACMARQACGGGAERLAPALAAPHVTSCPSQPSVRSCPSLLGRSPSLQGTRLPPLFSWMPTGC